MVFTRGYSAGARAHFLISPHGLLNKSVIYLPSVCIIQYAFDIQAVNKNQDIKDFNF